MYVLNVFFNFFMLRLDGISIFMLRQVGILLGSAIFNVKETEIYSIPIAINQLALSIMKHKDFYLCVQIFITT